MKLVDHNQFGQQPSAKGRLFPRLALLLVIHAHLVSILCIIAGLVGLLLLPALAKTTHVSENALLPGSARAMFSEVDAYNANNSTSALQYLLKNSTNPYMTFQGWLFRYLDDLGVDYYYQPFWPSNEFFSPLRFMSSPHGGVEWVTHGRPIHNQEASGPGVNIVGILRAPRGDGNEAIVLVSPIDPGNPAKEDFLTLGVSLVLLELLTRAHWLAKDVIWLAADGRYGDYDAVAAWLKEYHEAVTECAPLPYRTMFSSLEIFGQGSYSLNEWLDDRTIEDFKRAGAISAGFILKFSADGTDAFDNVQIKAEGLNAQMPNLDLINVVTSVATYRQGLQLKLEYFQGVVDWLRESMMGPIVEDVGKFVGLVYPAWGWSLSASEYVQGAATLLRSIWNQALGVPTGAHGAFRDYQLDALTLEVFAGLNLKERLASVDLLKNTGRLLEGAIRSVNNLLEKFHHSVFLYFMVSPGKFVPISIYSIPFGLLLLTLPLQAAALCSREKLQKESATDKEGSVELPSCNCPDEGSAKSTIEGRKSLQNNLKYVAKEQLTWNNIAGAMKWLRGVQIITLVEIWSIIVSLIPIFLSLLDLSSETKVTFWIMLACGTLGVAFYVDSFLFPTRNQSGSSPQSIEVLDSDDIRIQTFIPIKALTLGFASIMLGVMSAVNFAVAFSGVLIVSPMCLFAQPLSQVCKFRIAQDWHTVYSLVFLSGNIFTIILSAPVLLLICILVGDLRLLQLWNWTESLWFWGSSLYLFVFLIYLPCSVLCLFVIFRCK